MKKPSLFRGGLIGYFATTTLGSIVCWVVAARTGDFDDQRAFTLLISFGACGAFAGYEIAARRRKRLGVNEPSDEWQQFVGSWTFKLLVALVFVGSIAIDVVESLVFDLIYGAPWLQNR